MADLKISQLSSATTPLAGTEVVPIVQSGSTKKVAVSDIVNTQIGTWTATVTDGTTSVNGGTGWYIKAGKLVVCGISFYDKDLSGLSSSGLKIGGLPFANNGTYGNSSTVVATLTANTPVAAIVGGSNTYADMYSGSSGANLNAVTKASFADAAHASVQGTIIYYCA